MTNIEKKNVEDAMIFIEDTIKRTKKFKHRSYEITTMINFLGSDLCEKYCEVKKILTENDAMLDRMHFINMIHIVNNPDDMEGVSEMTDMFISELDRPLMKMVECTKRMATVLDDAMTNAPF